MTQHSIGLITYDYPHLKTEQVVQRLILNTRNLSLYALPFSPRPERKVLFQHRPVQSEAIHPEVIARKHDIEYIKCTSDSSIDNRCDLYLVLGAGILSPGCVEGKSIVNCHPGVIPASRGLDSFKWAILENKPLGITLHYIDAEVDAGEVISIIPTNVYETDTLETLARRHYENEIDCLARFEEYLQEPSNPFEGIGVGEARMRMPFNVEEELQNKFPEYAKTQGLQDKRFANNL